MADIQNGTPPAAEPAVEPTLEDEVNSVLGFGDDSIADADQIAARAAASPPGGAQPPEAGGAVEAPSAPPVTPPAGSEPSPTPAAPAPIATPPGTPPAPAASEPQPAAPAAQQPPSAEALRVQSLEAQVQALTQTLETLRSQPAQPGSQPAAQPGPDQPPQPVRYGLTLPPQVADALNSDDDAVRTQAITTIVNDIGTIIHNSVMQQMRTEVSSMFQALVSSSTQATDAQQREAAVTQGREAYYAAFPDHNNALILPLVQTEAQKMAAEYPHLKWGPDYINALGARVEAALTSLRGGAAPQPEQPSGGNGAPPARPAAMLPSGNRQGQVPGTVLEGSDLIMDTLDPFSG